MEYTMRNRKYTILTKQPNNLFNNFNTESNFTYTRSWVFGKLSLTENIHENLKELNSENYQDGVSSEYSCNIGNILSTFLNISTTMV